MAMPIAMPQISQNAKSLESRIGNFFGSPGGKGVKVAPAVEKGGVALVVWIVALVVGGVARVVGVVARVVGGVALVVWIVALVVGGVVLVVGGVARVVGVVGRVPQGACARYAGEVRLR